MTFSTDIPVTGNTLGGTRDRIRGNFQETAAVFAVNHVGFNTLGKGKHTFLQMPVQASAPTTLANESGFYSKISTNPAEPNLYFRGQSDGYEYQITRADSANIGTFATNPGWTFLPGGLLLQYGTFSSTGSNTAVVFPVAFSVAPYALSFSRQQNTSTGYGYTNLTNAGFTFSASSSTPGVQFKWMAIGVR